jgi:hypothetical protein
MLTPFEFGYFVKAALDGLGARGMPGAPAAPKPMTPMKPTLASAAPSPAMKPAQPQSSAAQSWPLSRTAPAKPTGPYPGPAADEHRLTGHIANSQLASTWNPVHAARSAYHKVMGGVNALGNQVGNAYGDMRNNIVNSAGLNNSGIDANARIRAEATQRIRAEDKRLGAPYTKR